MKILFRRRRRFKVYPDQLEMILMKDGVTPVHFFQDRNLLNYMVCAPYNEILHRFKISTVNIDLSEEEREFVNFILLYKKITETKRSLFDSIPSVRTYDSPILGWRDNPDYESECEHYKLKYEEYKLKMAFIKKRRREMLESTEGENYLYVESEDEKGMWDMEYRPDVTYRQRRKSLIFKERLSQLQDPVFTAFPCKKKSVFLRLTYEGQIFIK